jgi:hypothetical protein
VSRKPRLRQKPGINLFHAAGGGRNGKVCVQKIVPRFRQAAPEIRVEDYLPQRAGQVCWVAGGTALPA